MPMMDAIPLAWVQVTEGACIIEILHQCMLVNTKRDTLSVFNNINRQATEQYQQFFDSKFKALPLVSEISGDYLNYFKVASLNNRAVMA